jgi:hypothetical protein
MSRLSVLLVGAAGETGGSIATGLLENPLFVGLLWRKFLLNPPFLTHYSTYRISMRLFALALLRNPLLSLYRIREFTSENVI